MKTRKIISLITGAVMAVSTFSFNVVSANDSVSFVDYTLSELLEMSDEEFSALGTPAASADEYTGGAAGIIEYIERHTISDHMIGFDNYYKLTGTFSCATEDDPCYIPNHTEKYIGELFGDSMEYTYSSPIDKIGSGYYEYFYTISFLQLGWDENTAVEATHENIMTMSKILYCLRQVSPRFTYFPYTHDLSVSVTEEIIKGDVNIDKTLDVFDAIYIAKNSVGKIEFTDPQKQIADVNSDSEIDVFDAVAIAKETVK